MTSENARSYANKSRDGHLVFPEGDAPSISAKRVENYEVFVAPFSADSWPLAALDLGGRPSRTIHFSGWPAGFRDFARQVAYVLLNHGIPESLLEQPRSNAVRFLSGSSICGILLRLRAHVIWLTTEWSEAHADIPVVGPSDMDANHLDDLKRWLEQRHTDATFARNLWDVVRVWHLNPWLPDDCQWPEPAWRQDNWQPRRRKEENKTVTISESTFGPLLEWASAFINDFATDILCAQTDYLERIAKPAPNEGDISAGQWLDLYASIGRPLPPKPPEAGGKPGNGVGWHVLEYRHAVSAAKFSCAFVRNRKASLQISHDPTQTALDVSIEAKFRGAVWIPFIGVYDMTFAGGGKSTSDAGPLVAHLRTACLIVTAALTGMRPEEILDLRHGCAEEPIMRPGGSRLQLIHGRVFKGIGRLEDGSPGETKPAVWATVPLAASAIRTAERINVGLGRYDGLLFSDNSSVAVYTRTAAGWIQSFIEFVNMRLVPLTSNPDAFTIPQDADGRITLKRFRRTLAWFLKHRPYGDVTTAIQYQHVGVAMAEGYAGTKASGMPDLLLEEDWNHRVDTVRQLDLLLSEGKGINGPAARRAIEATQLLPRLLMPSDERRLRKDKSFVVYDNASAIALCVYRERDALCARLKQGEKDTQPDLLGCVDGCLNCARTDDHLESLSRQADGLRKQADMAPLPIAQSMRSQADRNEQVVGKFTAQRATRNEEGSSTPSVNDPLTES